MFSSMRSEDVLTSETSKLGVISLKGFYSLPKVAN